MCYLSLRTSFNSSSLFLATLVDTCLRTFRRLAFSRRARHMLSFWNWIYIKSIIFKGSICCLAISILKRLELYSSVSFCQVFAQNNCLIIFRPFFLSPWLDHLHMGSFDNVFSAAGMTPWMRSWPIARPLSTKESTTQKRPGPTSTSQVGLNHMIPVSNSQDPCLWLCGHCDWHLKTYPPYKFITKQFWQTSWVIFA